MSSLEPSPVRIHPNRPSKRDQQRLTPRAKKAMDLMIWQGMSWDQAAADVGLSSRAMRLIMERASCLAYFRKGKQERLAGGQAQAMNALIDIATTNRHMPGVQASKTLMLLSDEGHQTRQTSPGVVIMINQAPDITNKHQTTSKPLIEHEPVPAPDEEQE